MSKRLLGDGIEPKCSYCINGKSTPDGKNILCRFCGVPEPDYCCKKFKYDPLKREPLKPAQLSDFTADDFKL